MMTTDEPREPDASDLFAALPVIDAETTRKLHDRLVRDAQTAGLLDVAYRTIDSPVGPLLLAATAKGLVRVAYGCEDHEKVLERLARDLAQALTGHDRLVHLACPFVNHGIDWNSGAWLDEKEIADLHIRGRHLDLLAVLDDDRLRRGEIQQGADRVVGAATRPHLEPVAQKHKGG